MIKPPNKKFSFIFLLPAVVLFPRSTTVSSPHTLSTKRFTLEVLSLEFAVSPCGGENKFIKKGRVGKKFSLGGRKNTLLKTLVVALACSGF